MAQIRKSADGKFYYVRYDGPPRGDGSRNQKYKQFARRKDAELFLAEQKQSIYRGAYVEPSKQFLCDYLDGWLEENKDRLSPSTYSGYEVNVRCHIKPYLGGILLQALRPPNIRKLYRGLQQDRTFKLDGKQRSFKALSGTSVRYVHRVLHKALEDAVKDELIAANPASKVSTPETDIFEPACLDAGGINRMLSVFRQNKDDLYIPVLLGAILGIRRSEALGLQWSSVDFAGGKIKIRHAYIMDHGKPFLRNKTKSDKSRRDILVTRRLLAELKRHKKQQQLMKRRLKTYYASKFVCTWPDGAPINPSHLSRSFKARLQGYGLPVIRFHDLRHSNATLMVTEDLPLKGASDRLGHATVQFMQDQYVHPAEEVQRRIAEHIDQVIYGHKK